jgi:type I restriction enzyme S subunit
MKLKPYPEYKDSGVPWLGKIPAHWNIQRNKVLFKPRHQIVGDRHTEYTLLSLTLRGVIKRNLEGAKGKFPAEFNQYQVVSPGDFVFCLFDIDETPRTVGLSTLEGMITGAYNVYENISPESKYLYYYYLSVDERKLLKPLYTGLRKVIQTDRFLRTRSPQPPAEEQIQIAKFLNWKTAQINKFIRNKRRLIELLKEQKQNIINEAVTRGLDPNVKLKPSGVDWIGDIPEHWQVQRVGNFARVGNGSTPSRSMPGYWLNGHFPWLNSSQVNRGFIDSADQFVSSLALRECHLPILKKGTLLVAITGQGKTRGTAALLDIEATINQHLAFIDIRNPIVSVEYLQRIFSASYNVLRSISDASGSTKGALTCDDIKKFKVPLPPINEQDQILLDTRITTNAIDQAITRAEREIELMREYRTRLISDVVTGQVDVREIEVPEVGEELLDLEEDPSEAMDDELEAGEEE